MDNAICKQSPAGIPFLTLPVWHSCCRWRQGIRSELWHKKGFSPALFLHRHAEGEWCQTQVSALAWPVLVWHSYPGRFCYSWTRISAKKAWWGTKHALCNSFKRIFARPYVYHPSKLLVTTAVLKWKCCLQVPRQGSEFICFSIAPWRICSAFPEVGSNRREA